VAAGAAPRRLPKRALELPGERLRGRPAERWFYGEKELLREVEDRLAAELALPPGGVFVDYPEKPQMMGLNLLLRRGERTERLTEGGSAGLIDLPRVADELYHTARVFRVFTAERRELAAAQILPLLDLDPSEVRERIADSAPLL
jgi:hypothetical protein